VDVAVADERAFDFGLMTVRILDSVLQNCTVERRTESVPRNTYKVTILDPFEDAIYGFEAIDSASNVTRQIDTVPGFTLAIAGERGELSSTTIPEVPVGSVVCDTVWLSNYGSRTQNVRSVFVRLNVRFSLPPSQFEIVIPPGEQRPLAICYEPIAADESPDLDTLEFIYGCSVKRHTLSATGGEVVYSGLSRCNVPVEVSVERIPSAMVLMPSPAEDHVTIVLKDETDHASVRLVSMQGETVSTWNWVGVATRSLLLDLHEIAAGTYGVVVEHRRGTATSLLLVR
jgi:hypothetical protein